MATLDKEDAAKVSRRQKAACHGSGAAQHSHPDHRVHLKRLNRVKGQLSGIHAMIDERRYCLDILQQLKAARAGLAAMEAEIFKTHLRGCVKDAFHSRDPFHAESKVEEIMKILY